MSKITAKPGNYLEYDRKILPTGKSKSPERLIGSISF
jgi:hypothetical protein